LPQPLAMLGAFVRTLTLLTLKQPVGVRTLMLLTIRCADRASLRVVDHDMLMAEDHGRAGHVAEAQFVFRHDLAGGLTLG
jgi:hypothetical protein